MGRQICVDVGPPKVVYETREIAEIALEDMNAPGRRRPRGGKHPVRIYPCKDHFHLTSLVKPPR